MRAMLTAAALVLAEGCNAERPVDGVETSTPIPYETILYERHSDLDQPLNEVVRNEPQWWSLWTLMYPGATPRAAPEVDFARKMLIVVATGARPSGGFEIAVRSVVVRGDALEVEVLETCPAPDAGVTMELTRPVEVVILNRLSQGSVFRRVRSPSCH